MVATACFLYRGFVPAKSPQEDGVYPPTGLIVTVLGGKSRAGEQDDMSAIAVWSIHDQGDVPPLLILTDPAGEVPRRKIAFNPKAKEIIVGGSLSIRRYYLPEIF